MNKQEIANQIKEKVKEVNQLIKEANKQNLMADITIVTNLNEGDVIELLVKVREVTSF